MSNNTPIPNVRQFKVNDFNVKIDPNFVLSTRIGELRLGQKVVYSSDRGCYRFGYYLGASLAKDAVCLFSPGLGRISPHHLLLIDWSDYHLNDPSRLQQSFKDYMDLV